MLALCLMLLVTYYALNYAGIIGRCLPAATPMPQQALYLTIIANWFLQIYLVIAFCNLPIFL